MNELSQWFAMIGSAEAKEPQISLFMAYLHSPLLQDAMHIAIGLGALAGALTRRWWHGLIVSAAILAALCVFIAGYPVIAWGAPFGMQETWRELAIVYALLVTACTLASAIRWLAIRSWLWITKPT